MSKTARLTGLRAKVSLETGIARTYDWYRAHAFDRAAPSVR